MTDQFEAHLSATVNLFTRRSRFGAELKPSPSNSTRIDGPGDLYRTSNYKKNFNRDRYRILCGKVALQKARQGQPNICQSVLGIMRPSHFGNHHPRRTMVNTYNWNKFVCDLYSRTLAFTPASQRAQ